MSYLDLSSGDILTLTHPAHSTSPLRVKVDGVNRGDAALSILNEKGSGTHTTMLKGMIEIGWSVAERESVHPEAEE